MNGTIPADPWTLVTGVSPEGYRLTVPVDVAPVRTDPALRAYERVLAGAGASKVRDPVDRRVVAGVRTRTGTQIDSQSQVGGWPTLRSLPAPRDIDGDGMPDAWERRQGLDPRNPADANRDRDRDGYANIEEWLADAARGRG